jgi:hypothetical protein
MGAIVIGEDRGVRKDTAEGEENRNLLHRSLWEIS